jgi:hypothetical protein
MVRRRTKKPRRPSKSQGKSERTVGLNFRVLKEEKGIIDRLTADLVAKHPNLNRTHIIKELMGMTRSGFISHELRNRLFEECERLRKEERERQGGIKLPASDNDKSGYIHEPAKPGASYDLPSDAPLRLVKFEDEIDPIIKTGD